MKEPCTPHTHKDSTGRLHRCYHQCKNTLFSASFWLGVTLSFPLEHFLYSKVWPFTIVGHFFGLEGGH